MSLPILVTPAAKPLPSKPTTSATPSDKPSFSQAIGNAERRTETKPVASDKDVEVKSTPDKALETAPEAPVAEEQAPVETPVAQDPVDLQMMVAVASQVALPVIQAVVQPVQQVVEVSTAAAPVVETAAQAPVQTAPTHSNTQQAVAEQVKTPDVAAKAPVAMPTQGDAQAKPVDAQVAIAPAVQPETGDQQGESQDSQPQADKGLKAPVMPVATQQVPQSIESLRASEKVSTLVNAAPEAAIAKAPVADAAKPAQDIATAALMTEAMQETETAQPAGETVRPWQLPHAVGSAEVQAPQAQVIEEGAPTGEPMPMREAMRTTFTQAAKEPGKMSELRLQLTPEHLGRMEIRVMSHEGNLSAQIRVDHAQARDMMQVQIAELRQSLADQGIKIDRLEVSVGQDKPREQSFAFGGNLQQQTGQQQQQAHQPSTGRVSYYGTETFDEASEEAEGLPLAGVGATAVDYQA